MMNIYEALSARKSVRAFLDKPVDQSIIERILDGARHAPSGVNTQPWQVAVVSGEAKNKLSGRLEQAFRQGIKPKMDYQYYPLVWEGIYKKRRVSCGSLLYEQLGIKREDKERRLEQWVANYNGFGAPVLLFFFIDKILETGSYLDYGMFLQSIMLAAVSEGLGTCPQAALGEYPDIVKEFVYFPQETTLLCGMALGYEDRDAPVNNYRVGREEVSGFTRFIY